ncbi:MAG: DUF2807 domain-containing protein [Tannerellaceae bacterium]|jgi:hypothetical protein|nr:DUF2807 domain-containing protein [Tannerellaceae bacterium]
MKTKASLFLIGLLALATGLHANDHTIKGNGKVTTRTIQISDYDEISLAGSMDFEYEQSDAAPFLSITVDENIFEYLRAEVKNGELIIGSKQEANRGNGYSLQPTVFRVKSNSRNFKTLKQAGSGSFVVLSPLRVGALQLHTAGSGNVELKQALTGDELKINLAGSGNVTAKGTVKVKEAHLSLSGSGQVKTSGIEVESLHCSLSSSGGIRVEGSAQEANYSLAGSGSIKAYDCKATRVKASLTGSGRIETHAVESLSANTMGSGSITYKGSPTSVKENTTGSGSIRQAR